MHRFRILTLITLAAAFTGMSPPQASAAALPAQFEVPVPYGEAAANWDVPFLQNGQLLALDAIGITNGATVAVSHLVPYGSGSYVTNSVTAAAAAITWYAYPLDAVYTNTVQIAKPVWLIPGDKLRFVLSATNGQATVILRTGVR